MTALEIIREAAGSHVMPEDRIDDLAIDSLDLLLAVNLIEEHQGVMIAAVDLARFETVGDLVNFVREANLASV